MPHNDGLRSDLFAAFSNDQMYLDHSQLMMIACALTLLLAAASWRLWKDRPRVR